MRDSDIFGIPILGLDIGILKMFGIPEENRDQVLTATQITSERLFSTAGNIVTANRTRLLSENVEKLDFSTKIWNKTFSTCYFLVVLFSLHLLEFYNFIVIFSVINKLYKRISTFCEVENLLKIETLNYWYAKSWNTRSLISSGIPSRSWEKFLSRHDPIFSGSRRPLLDTLKVEKFTFVQCQ